MLYEKLPASMDLFYLFEYSPFSKVSIRLIVMPIEFHKLKHRSKPPSTLCPGDGNVISIYGVYQNSLTIAYLSKY
jgi:hypothetical protein